MADIFDVIADGTRRDILRLLLDRATSGQDGTSVSNIVGELGVSQPTVSKHLKVLREAGLVEQRAQGTHRFYAVRPEALRAIVDWTMDHRAFWSTSLDRLDTLLALDPGEGER